MHIGFRTSGGRGEYEVVGTHSGLTAGNLEGWSFYLSWPDGFVRDTDLELNPEDSGKPRLRSTRARKFQIGRMLAAMLLLPDPRRDKTPALAGLPVVRRKGYILSRVGFGSDTEFTGITDRVTISPSFVELQNYTDSEMVGVPHRWERIEKVYENSNRLPPRIGQIIDQHREYLLTGEPVTESLTKIVSSLSKLIFQLPGIVVIDGSEDPLPVLEHILDISRIDEPTLPPPNELGEDEPLVSARSAHEYRMAKSRGPAGRKFSREVHEAYGGRCAFCGGVFGGVVGIRAGVDAAHILAWSKYDLDVVPNGISLCKLHHWAFDAAILLPVYNDFGSLTLQYTQLSSGFSANSIASLGRHNAIIPDGWLPKSRNQWPSKNYLERLYADLAVSFSP